MKCQVGKICKKAQMPGHTWSGRVYPKSKWCTGCDKIGKDKSPKLKFKIVSVPLRVRRNRKLRAEWTIETEKDLKCYGNSRGLVKLMAAEVRKDALSQALREDIKFLAGFIQSKIRSYVWKHPKGQGSYERGVQEVLYAVMHSSGGHMNPMQVEWLIQQDRVSWKRAKFGIPC